LRIGVYLGDIDPTHGGGFTFQDDVFRALIELDSPGDHEIVVYCNADKDVLQTYRRPHLEFRPGYRRFRSKAERFLKIWLRDLAFFLNALHISGAFERKLREHRVDFMWFVTPEFAEPGIPFIYTVFDLQHRIQPWFPEVSEYGRWQHREKSYGDIIPRAFTVITGNEAGREELMRYYQLPPDRIALLPHPTPLFALRAPIGSNKDTLSKHGIPDQYIFYPAQFWPHKNHVGLLYAVKVLKDRDGMLIHVVLSGSDQGNLAHIKQVVGELGLAEQVHFVGFVSRDDLIALYRHAVALVYLTFFGPENLPPLEAFALGCPVIASNVPGAEQQLGDAALLVEGTNELDVADAIKSLYCEPDLRLSLAKRGRERAAQWTATDYVKAVIRVFDRFQLIRRCWLS
jgi:glycosyltransferase involved in cell wall biosynthesis